MKCLVIFAASVIVIATCAHRIVERICHHINLCSFRRKHNSNIKRCMPPGFQDVVSKGGYSAKVGGTTCAPCNAEWPSTARVLTSVAHRLSSTVPCHDGLPTCGHALARLWTGTVGLGSPRLIFSLVIVYYSSLVSYGCNCTQWQRRTPPA